MKLVCPKCKSELKQNEINIETCIAHCRLCNEVFKIAEYLRGNEEVRRALKPVHSNVSIEVIGEESVITIPKRGWTTQAMATLGFSILWNAIILGCIFAGKESPDFFLYIFVLIGIMLVLYSFFLRGCEIAIRYGRKSISVTWQFLKLKYIKTNEGMALEKVTEEVVYTRNYQPVYGIAMYFRYNRKIKFGTWLNEDERKWLIGEIYEIKNKFNERKQY